MAKIKVKHHSQGFEEVLNSKGVHDALEDSASDVADRARANAPFESGEYQESIDWSTGKGYDRWVGYVYATADHSLVVEARTGNLVRSAEGDA